MLFNSYRFIFLYFPIVFSGTFFLGRRSHRLAALWLGLSSLAFYAVWDARFVILLFASIAFNYGAGYSIGLERSKDKGKARGFLFFAISANLALLGYFKYTNFFIQIFDGLSGINFDVPALILPLGISFFTFTQIAYLVDVYKGISREYNFIHYLLFVTYFPHLIAGPILHHKQMMPQFANSNTYRINPTHVAVGLTVFILGLAKKLLLADGLGNYASSVFDAARDGHVLMLFESWMGALAYSLQLYFDFSGYSDMAIGLSLMFNISLPMNFDSPYKAKNIIDFWRRWHMTLSAFLRDYLYIPLGGNRKGYLRRHANLMATMLLGGLWHGAGLTFIVWGGLHGLYIIANYVWRDIKAYFGWKNGGKFSKSMSCFLTFIAVVVAWVFFRADSFTSAWAMLSGMSGMNGVSFPKFFAGHLSFLTNNNQPIKMVFDGVIPRGNFDAPLGLLHVALGLILVFFFPNVRQILSNYESAWEEHAEIDSSPKPMKSRFASFIEWRPTTFYAIVSSAILALCLFEMLTSDKPSPFLYFQF